MVYSFSQLYSINLINPLRKSESAVRKLCGLKPFTSIEELTLQVCVALKAPTNKIQLDFYEPGHGTKGRKYSLMMMMILII